MVGREPGCRRQRDSANTCCRPKPRCPTGRACHRSSWEPGPRGSLFPPWCAAPPAWDSAATAAGSGPQTRNARIAVATRLMIVLLLLHDEVRQVFFVFEANIIQQIGVELEDLIQLDGPGFGVRLGIIDRELDF